MSADLLELADRVVAWGRDNEQIEVVAWRVDKTFVRAAAGEVESLTSAQVHGVGVRVVSDSRQGFAYTTSLNLGDLQTTLADARDNRLRSTPHESAGLAAPDGVEPVELPGLFRSSLQAVSISDKIDAALRLEKAVRAADPRVFGVESAEYSDAVGEHCVVSSTGIRVADRESACYVVAAALAGDGTQTQTGFGFSLGRCITDLDVEAAGAEAGGRAARRLGAVPAPVGRRTLVLEPYVTAQLIVAIGAAFSGQAVQNGRSLFADRLGEAVASPLVTLVDDPTDPLVYTATRSDGEGLATRRTVLLRDGHLAAFLHNSATARQAGTMSTGSAARSGFSSTPAVACLALGLQPGAGTQADLLAAAGDAILVTDVGGLHWGVDTATGQLSISAEGHRVTAGEIGEPYGRFAISTTVDALLRNVVAVGGDVRPVPTSALGVSVVIGDVDL